MARTVTAIGLFDGQWRLVIGVYGKQFQGVDGVVQDRRSNGDACPGEHVIRLPRRLGIDTCSAVTGMYLRERRHSDGTINRNVY